MYNKLNNNKCQLILTLYIALVLEGITHMAKPQGVKPSLSSSQVANQQLEMNLLTAREEWGKGNSITLFKTPTNPQTSITYNKLYRWCTVEPQLTATLVIQSPRYYGHFFWPPGKNDNTFSCRETLVNMVTSLLRLIFLGSLVTALTVIVI